MSMKIGFIGLGKMGMEMASRLVEAGHEVVGYNRTRARSEELARRGGKTAKTIADAARDSELVITMVADDSAVEEVVFEPGGLLESLSAGRIHVSMSTVSPTLTRRLAQAHASRGQKFVSACVLGRPEAAAGGQLYVLPAGDAGSIQLLQPVFQVLGQKTLELGPEPAASNLMKLGCNFLIASVIESLSEVYALMTKSTHLDPERFLDVLTSTLFSGSVYEVYGRHVIAGEFKAGFRVPLAMKDIELGIAAGKEAGAPMPLASLIRDRFITAIARGWADLDWSALSLVSLEAAGLPQDAKAERAKRLAA